MGTPSAGRLRSRGRGFGWPTDSRWRLAAGPPLVDRPITADFDEQGRLYVSESSGSNDPVQAQLEEKPHRILRLEDTDGDGRFDRRVVFADGMMFPEGTLWYDGSLYVAAPPSIWKLTDTDGDGVADEREEWFEGKTLTGCANDLHGPYRGRDGWVYWCKGAFAEQTYEREGKAPLVTRAAHIFRRRPEGGEIEPVMTGGMDNPVDVVFTPGGERIFTTTFLQRPGGGRRDGLIHAIYGGVYGKVHSVNDDHPQTGPLMPVMVHLGPAAPSGLVHLESGSLGEGYRHNLLAALFNMQKVTRHVLRKEGATFAAETSDFLATDDIDFHPTDVLEDADGSVLVVDTGGWYKLCCPTSQLWKPDVLGAIYRVRRIDSERVADAWGQEIRWRDLDVAGLVKLLGDARPRVRERAMDALAKLGEAGARELVELSGASFPPEVRLAAVWSLCRNDAQAARGAVVRFLEDGDEDVRQAAIHAVSVHRDVNALTNTLGASLEGSMHNRRAAAEALGRLDDASVLFAAATQEGRAYDRVMEHAETYALIELRSADLARYAMELGDNEKRSRLVRMGLVALDQMPGEHVTVDDVQPLLSADDAELREAAWWVAMKHAEWGNGLAAHFEEQLTRGFVDEEARNAMAARLAHFARSAAVQSVMANLLASGTNRSLAAKRCVLDRDGRQPAEADADRVGRDHANAVGVW